MDPLDGLLKQVKATKSDTDSLKGLLTLLNKSEDLLRRYPSRLDAALHSLNPSTDSLGYLYFLEASLASTTGLKLSEENFAIISQFLNACDSTQVQLAPLKFNAVTKALKEHVLKTKEYIRAILPLKTAIIKIRKSSEHLTVQHAELAQVCLLAKCYSAAAPIFDEDVFEIEGIATGVQAKDFLLYCYYGGMIFIGLKKFQRAKELLSHTITVPGPGLSAITVAAYKKFVLVSLIKDGTLPPIPRSASSSVQRSLKSICQNYVGLANTFQSRDFQALKAYVASCENSFRVDGNLGLVKQVIVSVHKRNIQRLTQTFLTLSLQHIADNCQLAGPKEAEKYILRMISEGEIYALINQRDGMVHFKEDPEEYNSKKMAAKLDCNIQNVIRLSKKVAAVDDKVTCDKAFINKGSQKERGGRYTDSEDFEWGPPKNYDM